MILVNEMKRCLKPEIEVMEIDANLEEESFARALVDGFDDLFKRHIQSRDKGTRLT